MTKEEQKLLLKDLCARLPYYTKLWSPTAGDNWAILTPVVVSNLMNADLTVCQVKPYLRPMSSMTQEEMDNFQQCLNIIENENYGDGWSPAAWGQMAEFIHYCNEHHLDYNGLIAMGLALEAPKEMYND